jgi:hypothetical protein
MLGATSSTGGKQEGVKYQTVYLIFVFIYAVENREENTQLSVCCEILSKNNFSARDTRSTSR